ncbi:MAG: hypothetical protein ACE5GZ_14005 [Gammaproteobacteria bacterium]
MPKQLVDQTAHFFAGALLLWLFNLVMPLVFAFVLMEAVAVGREFYQHRNKQWGPFLMGPQSMMDVAFWLLGGIAGSAYVIYW